MLKKVKFIILKICLKMDRKILPMLLSILHNVYVLIDRIVEKDFDEDDIHRLGDSMVLPFTKVKAKCICRS